MTIRATFCLLGKSSATSAGMGMIKIARSVAICIAALENQRPGLLRHWPGTAGFQNLATGTQLRKALSIHQVPYVASMAIIIQQITRMRWVGKTRKYCIRIVAFAQRTAAL